jgi:hypothetical protein
MDCHLASFGESKGFNFLSFNFYFLIPVFKIGEEP